MNSAERIAEYKTLAHQQAQVLDKKVTAALKRGFELYGNPYVRDGRVCQAIVKRSRKRHSARRKG